MAPYRKMIKIDETKCDGCGACLPNCPEGALQLLDGKVRLVSDLFCDGLGACIGHCPRGAITVEEREALPYDEARVMENIVPQGAAILAAHLEHLRAHGAHAYLAEALAFLEQRGLPVPALPASASAGSGCPGSRVRALQPPSAPASPGSALGNWPIQLALVPANAPYLAGADILLAADCTGFAMPDFHRGLRDNVLLIACPKLDERDYLEKLSTICRQHAPRSLTVLHMEVPCCSRLVVLAAEAVARSGRSIPLRDVMISVHGDMLEEVHA